MKYQTIKFACKACGARLAVPALMAGCSDCCPKCQAIITAPTKSEDTHQTQAAHMFAQETIAPRHKNSVLQEQPDLFQSLSPSLFHGFLVTPSKNESTLQRVPMTGADSEKSERAAEHGIDDNLAVSIPAAILCLPPQVENSLDDLNPGEELLTSLRMAPHIDQFEATVRERGTDSAPTGQLPEAFRQSLTPIAHSLRKSSRRQDLSGRNRCCWQVVGIGIGVIVALTFARLTFRTAFSRSSHQFKRLVSSTVASPVPEDSSTRSFSPIQTQKKAKIAGTPTPRATPPPCVKKEQETQVRASNNAKTVPASRTKGEVEAERGALAIPLQIDRQSESISVPLPSTTLTIEKSSGPSGRPSPKMITCGRDDLKRTDEKVDSASSPEFAEIAVTAEARPALESLKKFLVAPNWQERLRYCQNEETTRSSVQEYYRNHGDGPVRFAQVELIERYARPSEGSPYCLFELRGGGLKNPVLALVDEPDKGTPRVNWEAFVEFKDRMLREFLEKPGVPSQKFRVMLRRKHSFDKDVPDMKNKESFTVLQPGSDEEGHVFVPHGSVSAQQLARQLGWGVTMSAIVELVWRKEGSHRWVEIACVVSYGWRN